MYGIARSCVDIVVCCIFFTMSKVEINSFYRICDKIAVKCCTIPENFELCRLEKTILRHIQFNLNVHPRWIALIQDGGQNHERAY